MVLPNAIREAAHAGDVAAIQAWFAGGGRDPDERDWDGWPLLYRAAVDGRLDLVRALLARGASVHRTNATGATPLHAAVHRKHVAVVALLLDHGARVDARTNRCGWTPLIDAASDGSCGMLRLLLRRGAALDTRDIYGDDAEKNARDHDQADAAALLAAVRAAGGWRAYASAPRRSLLALRLLCDRGRARERRRSSRDVREDLYRRLFVWHPPLFAAPRAPVVRAKVLRRLFGAAADAHLPLEIFWLILQFWRCDRDGPYDTPQPPSPSSAASPPPRRGARRRRATIV